MHHPNASQKMRTAMTSLYRKPAARPYYSPDFDEAKVNAMKRAARSPIMQSVTLVQWSYLIVAVCMTLFGASACSPFTSQNAKTVLDVAKVICIVANAESNDVTVKTICNIANAEDAALHSVLNEHRTQARRYAAIHGACESMPNSNMSDAGTEAGKR